MADWKAVETLPVFSRLAEISTALDKQNLLCVDAEPGAGKTTLIPWKLIEKGKYKAGKVILLEPRRLAARAAAERIADLLGEKPGNTVGLRTRYDSVGGSSLEVVTEGVLNQMLIHDPEIQGVSLILFDEFHERSLQGDLALALAWESRKVFRDDLGLLIMSATLPYQSIQKSYGDIPLISIPGRTFPVQVHYRPPLEREYTAEGTTRLCVESWEKHIARDGGDILVFLPGYREILKTKELLKTALPGAQTVVLHGSLPPEEQRRVLDRDPSLKSRIVLSTNVAETSVTLQSIRVVVDCGLVRRSRFSPSTGMDHMDTVPNSLASAEQRKGRAGRLSAGFCYRWWKESDYRDPFSQPEIQEADLARLVLDTALWGANNPFELTWTTKPSQGSVSQAQSLLRDLCLFDHRNQVTPDGKKAADLGLHPRLSRMVLTAQDSEDKQTAAFLAALLEEEAYPAGRNEIDLRDHLNCLRQKRDIDRKIHDEAGRIWKNLRLNNQPLLCESIKPESAGWLLLKAYPDRTAKRDKIEPGGHNSRWVMAGGKGALMEGPLSREEFIVIAALDGSSKDSRVQLAAPIDPSSIFSGEAGILETAMAVTWEGWKPKASSVVRLGKLIIKEIKGGQIKQENLEDGVREKLLKEGLDSLPWDERAKGLLFRCRFIAKHGSHKDWPDFSNEYLLSNADKWLLPHCRWSDGMKGQSLVDLQSLLNALDHYIGWNRKSELERLAPESFILPSGSRKKLDYTAGEIPVLEARLQEFFGCTETPRICGVPLILHLLSPAGRPVQITNDLDGFWDRTYPDVKKELKGRYPRHYWPDDPREAEPTARAKPRPK